MGAIRRHFDKRDILAHKFEVESKDVFHVKNLYTMLYEWFEEMQYGPADGEGYPEIRYWQRNKPDGSAEHDILWRFAKIPHKSSYIAWLVLLQFKTLYVKPADTIHDGKKVKTNAANVILRVQGWIIIDPSNKWEKNSLLAPFQRWFRERWYVQRIEDEKQLLRRDMEKLSILMKKFLEMKTGDTHYKTWAQEPFHKVNK